VADVSEITLDDASSEIVIEDLPSVSAADSEGVADANAGQEALGSIMGGGGGGLTNPESWSNAVNDAKEQWFSMFDRQRQGTREPCYALALLREHRQKFQKPAHTHALAEQLAEANVDFINQLWQAEIGQAALAEAVFSVADLRMFATVTDWIVSGQEARIRRIRGFLPARRADVITTEPDDYRTATNPGVQPNGCDDWRKRGCFIQVADGLYYARASNKLIGPRLVQLYDAIADNPAPEVVLATSAGRRFAGLSARWEVLEAIKAEYEYQVAWLMPQCLASRRGELPGLSLPAPTQNRDPRGGDSTPTKDSGILPLLGLLLAVVAFSGGKRKR
jgi:hypothetical protein